MRCCPAGVCCISAPGHCRVSSIPPIVLHCSCCISAAYLPAMFHPQMRCRVSPLTLVHHSIPPLWCTAAILQQSCSPKTARAAAGPPGPWRPAGSVACMLLVAWHMLLVAWHVASGLACCWLPGICCWRPACCWWPGMLLIAWQSAGAPASTPCSRLLIVGAGHGIFGPASVI